MSKWTIVLHSCNSNRRFSQTRSLTSTSMRLWWSFQLKCSKMPSTKVIFRNWRKRSIDYLDPMPLIFLREFNLMSPGKRSFLSWKMLHRRKTQQTWLRDLNRDSESPSKHNRIEYDDYRENYRQSYLRAKTEIRPLFARVTPHGAVSSRSPLVSMIFPSLKDKMKIF